MNEIFIQIITIFGTIILSFLAIVKLLLPKLIDMYINRIEHAHQRDIKELEANLHSQIETLKTSVEIAHRSEEELQSKRIAAVEKMWQEIMRLKREFAALVAIELVLTEEELYQAFQNRGDNRSEKIDEIVKAYVPHEQITNKLDNNTTGNPGAEMAVTLGSAPYPMAESLIFVTEDMHRIYGAIVRVYGRLGFLLTQKPSKGERPNWRDDPLIHNLIDTVLSNGAWKVIKKQKTSIHALVNLFEMQFLIEAKKAIHGAEFLTTRVQEVHQMIETQESDARNRRIGTVSLLSG